MLELCFLPLTWNVDPAAIDRSNQNRTRLISTCTRPVARVADCNVVHASMPCQLSEALEVAWLLKRWEQSTNKELVLSRSRQEQFRRTLHGDFNEHTVVAAAQLVGPVSADQLTQSYDWTIVESTSERVCIDAVSRDESDRLFFRSLRIVLSVQNGLPEKIDVVGRNRQQQTVWASSDVESHAEVIRLVHFENEVPPMPQPPLRPADTRFE